MKILIPYEATPAEDEAIKVSSLGLKLSEVTQGHHVGLIPITMKGENRVFERLYRVEVSGEASDNGKGYRRVMLKVTIPYHRIWTADPAAAANLRERQESASAGSISMHVVLSVPSRVRQDLIESSDAAATYGAEGHLAVVGALLSALTDQIRKPTLASLLGEGALGTVNPTAIVADEEGVATIDNTHMEDEYLRIGTSSEEPASVEPYKSQRFGTDGLTVDTAHGRHFLSQNPRDPLVRGLFGLAPIEENTNVVAGPGMVIHQLAEP